MRIGELAKRAGVNIQTLRFYEREGLLRQPPRTAQGYRVYAAGDLDRLRFIRLCQEMGFTLGDVRDVLEAHRVLALARDKDASWPQARTHILSTARKRLDQIDEKLAVLALMRGEMMALVNGLTEEKQQICPVAEKRAAGKRA